MTALRDVHVGVKRQMPRGPDARGVGPGGPGGRLPLSALLQSDRDTETQATVAVISVLVWPHDKHRAEPTANSDNWLSAAIAAAAC
jgi:hypothetical protein